MAFMCIVCRDLVSKNPLEDRDGPSMAGARPQVDIVATKCGHVYHLVCLDTWFNTRATPRQTCPHCQSAVNARDYQRLFLVGDEEADDIEKLQNEVQVKNQQSKQLETVKIKLETELKNKASRIGDKSLMFDILNEDYKAKLEELEKTRVELEELKEVWESVEAAHLAEKTELEEKMVLLQTKNAALEQKLVETQKTIDKLKTENALHAEQKLIREELSFNKAGQSNSSVGSTSRDRNPFKFTAPDTAASGDRLGSGSPAHADVDVFSRNNRSGRGGLVKNERPESASSMLKRSATDTSSRNISPMIFENGSDSVRDQFTEDIAFFPPFFSETSTTSASTTAAVASDGANHNSVVSAPIVRKNSMAVQTDTLDLINAPWLLKGEEPLSVCIKILEEERRKKENLTEIRKELRAAVGETALSKMNGFNGNNSESASSSERSGDRFFQGRPRRGMSLFN